ncbi:alpha-L-rhamnosidase [Pseudopedobacter saltans DSM 12145]|uniref:alpha-L-rhamnosidase n=1 Tax=Pseudopedobacter saltans (strain ATCC 51119 / DSM 12145 / JCM 21818 / CCUG 39354 / LMG 10337 / NBRC 100064 / NCIMB 13643) TaxID=762903 RepID=F0SAM3_PSESL|nr:family 78 glycoside hydrolase catalytic domain [Pseudopedobacter saltans]ADY53644.1 alpha-L-rhamnosidase [Pseudopedobacter saltans DSM 12145]
MKNIHRHIFLMPLIILLCVVEAFSQQKTGSIKPVQLRCEYLENPLGLDLEKPRLSWVLQPVRDTEYGQMQTAYRIIVASSVDLLEKSQGDVWDTKWVTSDQMQLIDYSGKALVSDRTYFWKVKVKDEKGRESAWSDLAFWSTGLFDQKDWSAKWIGSDELYDKSSSTNNISDPWFRKSFELNKKPGKASLFVASVGYHEVYVNGERIGDHVLAPAVSNHTKRARYIAYDIADKLVKGKNVIAVWLGTSWSIFPGYILNDDRPLTPIVKAQVAVYEESNPSFNIRPITRISTDETWKTKPSPNKLLGKWDFKRMGGEIWDARLEDKSWNQIKCDESKWKPSIVYPTKLILSSQAVEHNRVFEEIKPVNIKKRKDGSYRVDMGVNFAGWTQVNVSGTPGDTIKFQYSEREQNNMTFGLHSAYVLNQSGTGTFTNRFNYSSGRWITVKGLKKELTAEDVKGWMVRTDFKNASSFQSSDTLQNWMYDRIKWTFENLSLGGFIVDCPQRERMGYGGDAHATSETGMFNYQMGAFYTKWMEDWRDVQGTESMVGDMLDTSYARKHVTSGRILNNGVIPHTAPTIWGGGGPAWGGIVITLPWFMYQHYGDIQVLEKNFEMMKGWLSFLDTHVEGNLMRRFGGEWDFLGDWLWPNATAEGMNNDSPQNLCLNNSYYIFNLRTAAKVARLIGKNDDAAIWEKKAELSSKAVNEMFYNKNDYSYSDGTMSNLAAALLAEVPPKELREKVLKRLEKEILEVRKGHIHAGITGGALLFKLLRDEGRDDLIYSITSKKTYPSWGYMKDNDATTIWEMWEKDLPGHSLLHSSYLYPGAWFIDGIGGIRRHPDYVGFKHFIIRPPAYQATEIKSAQTKFESPVGGIEVNWERIGKQLSLEVVVPPNSVGVLQLKPQDIIDISKYKTVKKLPNTGDLLQYEILPGKYSFK